jgi:phosphopantetheinyl transferase (holo-ACP synthase)
MSVPIRPFLAREALTEQEREAVEQEPVRPHEVVAKRFACRAPLLSGLLRERREIHTNTGPRERLVVRRIAVRREARDEHRAVVFRQELHTR